MDNYYYKINIYNQLQYWTESNQDRVMSIKLGALQTVTEIYW